jgi:hypothetical protein
LEALAEKELYMSSDHHDIYQEADRSQTDLVIITKCRHCSAITRVARQSVDSFKDLKKRGREYFRAVWGWRCK